MMSLVVGLTLLLSREVVFSDNHSVTTGVLPRGTSLSSKDRDIILRGCQIAVSSSAEAGSIHQAILPDDTRRDGLSTLD